MTLQIVYKGTDLTAIHADPKQPQKYARKVLQHLFSNEELSTGIYQKVGNTSRYVLDPARLQILEGKEY